MNVTQLKEIAPSQSAPVVPASVYAVVSIDELEGALNYAKAQQKWNAANLRAHGVKAGARGSYTVVLRAVVNEDRAASDGAAQLGSLRISGGATLFELHLDRRAKAAKGGAK